MITVTFGPFGRLAVIGAATGIGALVWQIAYNANKGTPFNKMRPFARLATGQTIYSRKGVPLSTDD